ncbi:dTDP-4-amino-4,6-dideoxygalactose transaminase [Altibacter sp.]|uniref:dTDP-4-amino-4,6-dideoxygalactose transaminase n=1 Tax=Altibacter sp. TaxID=2024823 RepID=UPI000C92CC83|nr:dTDP-4-amino-4,6-dideoxygalactose transaminase [Altibacter sp.]MAP54802.1 dTDP-4-amino-4,6-dideoxygalactose transaminase [Altibacter sp.]
MNIPFNKPYLSGKELTYIADALSRGHLSGNGYYSQQCHQFFTHTYGFKKALLTTSCTDALEMAALLLDIQPGDEVIMPSFTFVSTANAFELRGAVIRFVDSQTDHPGMDASLIAPLINEKTKAIVVVHYAGVACDMDAIMPLANAHDLFVVEDAAQAIDSYYKGRVLGSLGHLGAFSFHETKNIQCGEGGLLTINDARFTERAEILWEKGTNRSAFFRGEVDKYGWVDIGSSFLPSELNAAYLFGQLECLQDIQNRRKHIWERYHSALCDWATFHEIAQPKIPEHTTNNAHMYYVVCKDIEQRSSLIQHLKALDILAVFHYQSLHKSPYFKAKYTGEALAESDRYSDCLLRLPLFYELDVDIVINALLAYEA